MKINYPKRFHVKVPQKGSKAPDKGSTLRFEGST